MASRHNIYKNEVINEFKIQKNKLKYSHTLLLMKNIFCIEINKYWKFLKYKKLSIIFAIIKQKNKDKKVINKVQINIEKYILNLFIANILACLTRILCSQFEINKEKVNKEKVKGIINKLKICPLLSI
ncbi:hypothetical protein [Spiroplasma endosymbiont of Cantharis nigra]|uniref:hypothetical protein n=1 Tax=Spiroplasma endosymbiont of Cantharis nigra TaxID=3066278 RepID=UPI0030CE4D40